MTQGALTRRLSPLLAGALLASSAGLLIPSPSAAQESPVGDRLLLDVGHSDAFEVSLDGDELALSLKDDTFLHADQVVYRGPDDVVFQVKPESAAQVPPGEQWTFLGDEGDTIYMLPQTQNHDLLWPGWSTERLRANQIDGQVELSIADLRGPGELKLFQSGIGGITHIADTDEGLPVSWGVNVPAHVHANWVFTEPGTYVLTVEADATVAGVGARSVEADYVFHVGDIADYEDPFATDPIETTLSIEGLSHHYHTGDAIELTAVQDPETELDHYHWFTRTDAEEEWEVVPDAGTDTLSLTAGDAPALDGTQVIARLYGDDHEAVAESDPVTIVIDDHDDGDHPDETTLTIEGVAHHYHTGDTATLTAVQDPETDFDHYHWFVTPAGGTEEVVPGEGTDTYSFTVTADWDGAQVVAKLYDDDHEVVATSEPVTIVVDDHDDDHDAPLRFADVSPDSPHAAAIAELAARGITVGKTPTTYDPAGSVTRGQLASFVARSLELEDVAASYSDVPVAHVHAGAIGAVSEAGYFEGFEDGTFRPGEPVTRDQIAGVLARALGFDGHLDDHFSDLAGSAHRSAINALADVEVARGGTDGTYDPREDLRRDQMASLLIRALHELED